MLSGFFCPTKSSSNRKAEAEHEQRKQLESEMGRISKKYAKRFDSRTRLPSRPLIVIDNDRVTLYKLLGKGGFNDVYEVSIRRRSNDGESYEDRPMAMKGLKTSIMKERTTFVSGVIDLVTEAKLLNALRHKNIIHLHGVSCDNDSLETAYHNESRFHLYLDILHDTVDDVFDQWRHTYIHDPIKKREHLRYRLESIALPIAEAMEYLHANRIIFRDLKPLNMGFDDDGVVKLFDFGLARELNTGSSPRRLTGATGSRRYMAPEVALSCPYGLPADVYSFGIFLFECTTLQKPFDNMSRSEHSERVVYGRYRPSFPPTLHSSLRRLIQRCWSKSPRARPEFSQVVEQLKGESMKPMKSPKKDVGRFFFRIPRSPPPNRSADAVRRKTIVFTNARACAA